MTEETAGATTGLRCSIPEEPDSLEAGSYMSPPSSTAFILPSASQYLGDFQIKPGAK